MGNIKITVALAKAPTPELFEYNPPKFVGESLPEVELLVAPADTLGTILDRAAADFGIALSNEAKARFQHIEPNRPLPKVSEISECIGVGVPGSRNVYLYSHLITLDNDGRAHWNVRFNRATYGQLTDSISAGIHEGDARRLYLHPWPGGSAALISVWADFFEILKTIYDLYAAPGAIWASSELIGRVRRRMKRAKNAVQREAPELANRGATPEDVSALLERKRWNTGQVARLLGTDDAGAIAWLEMLGFHRDDDGYWRRGGDLLAEIMHRDSRLAMANLGDFLSGEYIEGSDIRKIAKARVSEIVHDRITYVLEHNQLPPLEERAASGPREWTPPL